MKKPSSLKASFLNESLNASELAELDASDASSGEIIISSGHFPSDDDGEMINPYRRGSMMARLSTSTANATTGKGEDSPNELAAEVALGVKDHFRQMLPQNLLHEYNSRDCIAPFQTNEIVIGRKLGSGEFSHAYEIRCFKTNEAIETGLDASQRRMRNYMKKREKYRDTKKTSYAVKHLRQELITKYDKLEYAQAASDLAMEAEFLSSLQHPNIIKLRGISFAGPKGFQQGPKGFFLIIDRLDETLDKRLMKWERARKGILPNRKKPILKKKDFNVDNPVTEEQWDVCLRIAAALVYLHEKNIIFRDLKPANVGFDVRGDVKLFDFGLATIVKPEGDPYEDTYEMSGAGSPRYMSPEVLKEEPDHYNLKADVYTFSIVTWQVLSLQQPFSFVRSRGELVDHVLNEGGRPEIPDSWPKAIKETMRAAFDVDMGKRPTMSSFYETLRLQLKGADTENSEKFDHRSIQRRRSTYSLRKIINGDEEAKSSRGLKAKFNKKMDKFRDKFHGRRFSDH